MTRWRQIDVGAVAARVAAGETVTDIASELGMSREALSKRLNRWRRAGEPAEVPAASRVEVVDKGDGSRTVEAWPSQRVRSLDDLLDLAGTDRDAWRVTKHIINNIPTTIKRLDGTPEVVEALHVKAWLAERRDVLDSRELARQLVEDMRAHAPLYDGPAPVVADASAGYLLELALADVHVGEGAGETFDHRPTLDEGARLVPAAVGALAARAASAFPVAESLLYVGGDLLHADGYAGDGSGGRTTRGTVQDVSAPVPAIFRASVRAVVEAAELLRPIGRVRIVFREGNHDGLLLFAVGEAVAAWFRLDDRVEVVNDGHPEATVVEWGSSLIGFLHGHKAKDPRDLAIMLADMAPAAWARSTWREIHRGHYHGAGGADRWLDEVRRVRLRTVPSLSVGGLWAAGMGWRHVRAAEAYLWGAEPGDGMVAMFSTTAAELERRGLV